nr:hypothetical protein StreXyl84_62700 [Streptomyces sp. Xyl84]
MEGGHGRGARPSCRRAGGRGTAQAVVRRPAWAWRRPGRGADGGHGHAAQHRGGGQRESKCQAARQTHRGGRILARPPPVTGMVQAEALATV